MSWLVVYLVVVPVVAAAAFVVARWCADQRIPGPDRSGVIALATGAIWPALVVGGVQLAVVVAVRRLLTGGEGRRCGARKIR